MVRVILRLNICFFCMSSSDAFWLNAVAATSVHTPKAMSLLICMSKFVSGSKCYGKELPDLLRAQCNVCNLCNRCNSVEEATTQIESKELHGLKKLQELQRARAVTSVSVSAGPAD